MSMADRRLFAEHMRNIVNTCREQVKNANVVICDKPEKYSCMLVPKKVVDDIPAIHVKPVNNSVYVSVKDNIDKDAEREGKAIKNRPKFSNPDFDKRIRRAYYVDGIKYPSGSHRRCSCGIGALSGKPVTG